MLIIFTIFSLIVGESIASDDSLLFSLLNRTRLVHEADCRIMCADTFTSKILPTYTSPPDTIALKQCERTCSLLVAESQIRPMICSRQCGRGCVAACDYTADMHRTSIVTHDEKWCRFAEQPSIVRTAGKVTLQWSPPQMYDGRWCTVGVIDYTILHRSSSYIGWSFHSWTRSTEFVVPPPLTGHTHQWTIMAVDTDGLLTETRVIVTPPPSTTTSPSTTTATSTTSRMSSTTRRSPQSMSVPDGQVHSLDDERLVLYAAVFGCAFFLGLTVVTFVCYCMLYKQRQRDHDRTTVYPVCELPHSRAGSCVSNQRGTDMTSMDNHSYADPSPTYFPPCMHTPDGRGPCPCLDRSPPNSYHSPPSVTHSTNRRLSPVSELFEQTRMTRFADKPGIERRQFGPRSEIGGNYHAPSRTREQYGARSEFYAMSHGLTSTPIHHARYGISTDNYADVTVCRPQVFTQPPRQIHLPSPISNV